MLNKPTVPEKPSLFNVYLWYFSYSL